MSEIYPAAKLELEDATLYYADISVELAEKFLIDFEQTLSFIEAMPLAWAVYFLDIRKLNFKIFPYSIVYSFSESDNEVVILAIQHQSRKPFYWKDRI
jgi:plasmid stabilization system protein ParE